MMATVDYRLSNGKTIRGVDSRLNPADVLMAAREQEGDEALEFAFEAEAPTPLERVGAGVDDVFSGVRQSVGELVAPDATAEFTKRKREEKATYERGRANSGQDGIDWWRIAGNIAGSAPAMLVPGGQTTAARMGSGAATGAALGYLSFVPGAADGQTAPSDRLVNSAVGAAAGGAAPGLFNVVGYLGRNAGQAATGAGRAAVAGIKGKPASQQLDDIWTATRQGASARGLDLPDQMPVELRRVVEQDIRDATRKGVDIDPEALLRKLELEAAGYQPRTGQITRDPKTFALEENQRSRFIGEGQRLQTQLEEQSRKMAADLDTLAGRFGNQLDGLPGEKGQRVMDTIEAEWKRSGEEVSAAYKSAREARGDVRTDVAPLVTEVADYAFEGGKTALGDLAELTMNRLKKYGLLDADGNIKEGASLAMSQLEDLRKGISRTGTIKGTTQAETLRAKAIITNLIDDVAERSPAGDVFAPARAQARARFQMFEGKALDDVLSGKADPERFFQRHVIGASVNDLKKTMAALEASPDGAPVAQMMRREMVDAIVGQARDKDGFVTAAGLERGIKLVGRDKIKQVLGDDVLRDLEKNKRFAEWLFTEPTAPGGSLINRSRTGAETERIQLGEGGLSGMLINTAQRAAENASERRAAQAALRGGIAPTAPADLPAAQLVSTAARKAAARYNAWVNKQSKGIQDLMLALEPIPADAARAAGVTGTAATGLELLRTR